MCGPHLRVPVKRGPRRPLGVIGQGLTFRGLAPTGHVLSLPWWLARAGRLGRLAYRAGCWAGGSSAAPAVLTLLTPLLLARLMVHVEWMSRSSRRYVSTGSMSIVSTANAGVWQRIIVARALVERLAGAQG